MSSIIRRRRGDIDGATPFDDAPPGRGENIIRNIHDDERGIRFEVGKMVQYAQSFMHDPLVLRTARNVVSVCRQKDKLCEMQALFLWVKGNYRYVNDPPGREVIQTPVSQIMEMLTPPHVLRQILGDDLIRQMEGFGARSRMSETAHSFVCASCFRTELSGPKPKTSGDCDEGATLLATMLGAVGIVPRFRFGGMLRGNACNYHHVWVQARDAGGNWIDMDVTEEKSKLGWFFEGFDCFGHAFILPKDQE